MAENEKVKRVCLDDLIQDFLLWEKNLRDAVHDNNCLQMEIRSVTKKLQSSEEAQKIALEDENEKLKTEIAQLKDKLRKIEEVLLEGNYKFLTPLTLSTTLLDEQKATEKRKESAEGKQRRNKKDKRSTSQRRKAKKEKQSHF